jgi:hypothetical protein
MCCGSLSPLQTVCDFHLCRRAVEDSPDPSSEGWSEPNNRLLATASSGA